MSFFIFSMGLMFALLFIVLVVASLWTGHNDPQYFLISGSMATFFLWHTRKEFKNRRTIANAITYIGILLFAIGMFPVVTGYGGTGGGSSKRMTKVNRDHQIIPLFSGLFLLVIGLTARRITEKHK